MPPARDRVKAIPWALLAEAAMLAHRRWTRLTPGERAHLLAVVRKSRGRPGNLTPADKSELRRLVTKLDFAGAARDAAPLQRRWRGRRGT